MPRVKRGVTSRAKHKKVLERTEGHYGARHTLIKTARESVMHAQAYAYRDRRNRKRDMRALWITRINAASRLYGMTLQRPDPRPRPRRRACGPQDHGRHWRLPI